MEANDKKERGRRLREKARLLWKLVTTTPGVGDLAEPMRRVERDFERLTRSQQTTIAVIVTEFERGSHGIEEAQAKRSEEVNGGGTTEETKVIIPAEDVEVIPPGQPRETETAG